MPNAAEKIDDMDFDLAFDEALTPVDEETETKESEEAKGEESEEAKGEASEEAKGEETEEAKGEETEEAKGEASEEAKGEEPKAEEPNRELLDRIAVLENDLKKATQEPEKEPEPAKPVLSEEEQAAVAELRKEWPDLAAGMDAQLKLIRSELVGQMTAAFQNYTAQLQPMLQTVNTVGQSAFLTELTKLHADTETIYPQVETWVATLPGVMKEAYDKVLDEGSAAEVAAVFDHYKQLHPTAAPKAETPAVEKKKEAEPDPKKEEKLELMSGVKRERSGVQAEPDVNDFDAAFDIAADTK